MQREGNTLSPVARQGWDTGDLKTLTKNDPTVATGAHISILGHITRDELGKLLSECDTANGFANRFLWILVKRSKLLPDGGRQIDLTALQARLQNAVAVVGGCMARSSDAQRLWHDLYPLLTAERPGRFGSVTSRAEAQTLRLSMVYAVMDASTIIQAQHLQAAYAVWKYAEASARCIFGESDQLPPLEKKLMQTIAGKPGINRKELHKALGGHVKADAMVKALGRLARDGLARAETVSTGGRPCECWWTAKDKPDAVSFAPAPQPEAPAPMATAEAPAPPNGQPLPSKPANERTKSTANGKGEGLNSDSSLVRSPAAKTMPLADLLVMVQQSGGKIVRSADGTFVVEGVDDNLLTPEATAALAKHQAELAMLVPTVKPMTDKERRRAEWLKQCEADQAKQKAEQDARMGEEMSDEEFNRELDQMN
jgi:hypothetical protein